MTDLGPIIDLLAANLGNLTTSEGDHYQYVPFLTDIKTYGADDDTTNLIHDLHRGIAEGIANLLHTHGHLNTNTQQAGETVADKITTITCAQCSAPLITLNTNRPISGKTFIEAIAQRDPHCATKHAKQTPDTIRAHIQQQIQDEEEQAAQ